ncbi:glycoside hydrolase family 78 protein [Bacteroides sp. 224]|uniref:glycoside hydrolase family 78 protein n=1 Tax=Bacteroides sp. 224 TaxID=2302936 RepID=UPI0013CF8E83|nr:glycoside hydrolase family 78 protein [Bacteroides sp. 224]NDV64054.1 hydrolase [Bacteroides sp. 224]
MNRFLWVLLSMYFSLQLQAKGIVIDKLTTELQDGFAIVDNTYPRLSWTMKSDENGTRQTAYEIEIREAHTNREVWNSGKVISSQNHLVPTDGAAFRAIYSHYRYTWRVRVWDEVDTPSSWSEEVAFRIVTGQELNNCEWVGVITRKDANLPEGRKFHGTELKKPEVKAAWDAVDSLSRKSICLRKAFAIQKDIIEATVFICGLGNYELSFNGKKVGDSEFAPLWSDFDKTVYYNVYDVTGFIKKGENTTGVLLGNGFYNVQGGRYTKLKISFGPPTLSFKLLINYTDGTSEEIKSGADWKYSLSPLTFNCIYGGENYDARLEQKGWNKPGFDDSEWLPVVVQEAPKGKLRPQQTTPVKIMERYDIQKVTKLTPDQVISATKTIKRTVDPSAFVLDMGQNLAGFPEITVKGKKGQTVTLLVGESLTEEGAVNQRQTGRQHYYQYTLKGDGEETWHPRFSYYGFRYIQVEGTVLKGKKNPQNLPVLKKIQSCFIYNSAPKVSTFETSNQLFNDTHRLIEKAVRSNMQSVFTDCPHREKLGWLEQTHLNGPGLLYNYDLRTYIPKIMQDMADAQMPNGAMPTTAPQYVIFDGPGLEPFAESPEWGSALVILPFMYYEFYGDDSLITKYFHNMRSYVDYLTSRADNHIVSFGLGDWYDYGDFKAGFSRNTPVALVATAHYYMAIECVRKASSIVGNQFDKNYYMKLAQKVKDAFNEKFLNVETSQYGTGSQCSNALPLFLNMVDFKRVKGSEVLQNLVTDIEAHGNRLTTGDVGNRYLFQSLARNGYNELMYKMFNHYEAPGYGFQLKFGATTLTEQWDPRQGSSWNHFMMGQIDEWFFHSLAGIESDSNEKGFKKIRIRPNAVGDLTSVKASTATPYGEVKVSWKRSGNNFTMDVYVPVNTTAKVYVPGKKEPEEVGSGHYTFQSQLE